MATSLPFPEDAFDAAVMALVIFFVPEPERGLMEMVRVTKPGGLIAAYAWDVPGGGFPNEAVTAELRDLGVEPLRPPRADVSSLEALKRLWTGAGLLGIASRTIDVEREFASFDEWWLSIRGASSLAAALDGLTTPETMQLRNAMRNKLGAQAGGRILCRARANAILGVKPM